MVLRDAAFEFGFALVVESDARLGGGEGVAVFVKLLAELGQLGLEHTRGGAGFGDELFLFRELAGEVGILRVERADRGGELGALGGDLGVALVGEVGVEHAVIGGERLETAGLRDLAFQRVHAALLFGEHVGYAEQVRLGVFEFAQRVLLLALEFRDAGRFLEHRAAFLGFRGKDLVDLALRHDRVGGAADAGIHEQVVDVAQTAERSIQSVFGAPVTEDPAGDGDLVEIDFERLLAIRHRQRDLRHAERLAFFRAVKNDICHLAAAQGFRGSLAEHPADGVHDVGFSATIRADDARDALGEFEHGLVGEGFEALDFEGFEIHGVAVLS